MEQILKQEYIDRFAAYLYEEEKARLTIEKYVRDVRHFYDYLPGDKVVTKDRVIGYKESLRDVYRTSSANSMLAALNMFFHFMGWEVFRVKQFKQQKSLFCRKEKCLTKKEYERLIDAASREGKVNFIKDHE